MRRRGDTDRGITCGVITGGEGDCFSPDVTAVSCGGNGGVTLGDLRMGVQVEAGRHCHERRMDQDDWTRQRSEAQRSNRTI